MKHFKALALCAISALMLNACAEAELAAHVAKKTMPIPESSKTTGTFKVGSPYTIKGQRYTPRETYSFEQTGIASWYGPNFHGKKTANGETFDMFELTAAHKTLQMPSLVRVTNLGNGKSIVVRINDRGPFSKGRIIDLSKRSAELLGFKNQGTAKVKLQLLSNESRQVADAAKQGLSTRGTELAMNERGYQQIAHTAPKPASQSRLLTSPVPGSPTQRQPAQAVAAPSQNTIATNARVAEVERADLTTSVPGHIENGKFYPDPVVEQRPVTPNSIYVQAASFGTAGRAEMFAKTLTSVADAKVYPAIVNGANYYRVRIGPLQTVPEADLVLQKLASIGRNDAIVVVD